MHVLGQPKLLLDGEGDARRLTIALPMFVNGEELWARPIPPLNFTATVDGKPLSYRPEIDQLVETKGRKKYYRLSAGSSEPAQSFALRWPRGLPRGGMT